MLMVLRADTVSYLSSVGLWRFPFSKDVNVESTSQAGLKLNRSVHVKVPRKDVFVVCRQAEGNRMSRRVDQVVEGQLCEAMEL